MTRCLDLDELVGLGSALDWRVDDALGHLRNCDACREEIARLMSVHGVLAEREAPRAGFTDHVMAGVTATDARRTAVRRLVSVSLTPILAGATAFFSIALAATGPSPVQIGPVAVGAAMVVAVVTALWDTRQLFGDGRMVG